ncbi:alpha-tocopherol transfer protein-like isoform X1 [Ooceraea biroi]|uniref:Alpha-tocopherol transfer protein-like protein n=1 Tax=Ooceraea biroi TaxID=2015173 RepID=A0A026VZJ6_OOCBI|nr:alpha-tocopherol transfer protein-like isoform X1 [Ooceraea biroi]EZA49213.1 Alpha-tocopherol transfer protein-like protein [Ooceraea biroi]
MEVLPPRYVSIEEECKRNPELKLSDMEMLKDWMDKQPHLPKINMLYLVMFLHSNYYRIEPTKQTIDNFFTARTHTPEIFSNRDPVARKELRKAFTTAYECCSIKLLRKNIFKRKQLLKLMIKHEKELNQCFCLNRAIVPLKYETKEGYIVTLAKFLDPDPTQFDSLECSKYMLMTCEVQNIVRGTSKGLVVVLDAADLSFGHVARMDLMKLKKMMYYIQEAAPVRIKALHIINTMPVVDRLFNLMKPFIKTELLDLLHFHSSLNTLMECLPIEALPNEYGGKAGPIQEIVDEHIKLLEEFRDWFQYDERVGRVNESLRVGKCHMTDGLFGMDGSFKKLEID